MSSALATSPELSPPATTTRCSSTRSSNRRITSASTAPTVRAASDRCRPASSAMASNSTTLASSGPSALKTRALRPAFNAAAARPTTRSISWSRECAASADGRCRRSVEKPLDLAHRICPAVTGEQLPLTTAIRGTADAAGSADCRGNSPMSRQCAANAYCRPDDEALNRPAPRWCQTRRPASRSVSSSRTSIRTTGTASHAISCRRDAPAPCRCISCTVSVTAPAGLLASVGPFTTTRSPQ